MTQPYPDLHQPHGLDEQTVRIPRYPTGATPAPAPKRTRRWPWVVGGLVLLGIIGSATGGNDGTAPATPPAPFPAAAVPAAVPAAPAAAPVAAPPVMPPAPAEPAFTVSQENAVDQAESYLGFTAFSRSGLIDQLEFEGFSTADATFAVDTITVDWMVQAEKKAQSYLDFSSFSRSGLIDQLEFEGFTPEQAEHGADAVGL